MRRGGRFTTEQAKRKGEGLWKKEGKTKGIQQDRHELVGRTVGMGGEWRWCLAGQALKVEHGGGKVGIEGERGRAHGMHEQAGGVVCENRKG